LTRRYANHILLGKANINVLAITFSIHMSNRDEKCGKTHLSVNSYEGFGERLNVVYQDEDFVYV